MEYYNLFIPVLFLGTTALTIGLFYRATNRSRTALAIVMSWVVLQTVLSLSGFYKITNSVPPRILLLILPPVLCIIILFVSDNGRQFIARLNPTTLCLLFVIRIPVELVLYSLFLNNQVPGEMTFAGGNYDIFSGLTAPFIYYYGFVRKQLNRKIIFTWNIICMGLLISVVIHAILASPSNFQQIAFNQPNVILVFNATSHIVYGPCFPSYSKRLWPSIYHRNYLHDSDYQSN
jgi:hypothetical protein